MLGRRASLRETPPSPPGELGTQSLAQQIGELQFTIEKLNVSKHEWTVEEDCFIIRHFDIRKTAKAQIEALYFKLRGKNPDFYPKEDATQETLRQRFDELSNPLKEEFVQRYAALLHLEKKLCEAEDAVAHRADRAQQQPQEPSKAPASAEPPTSKLDVKVVDLRGITRSKTVDRQVLEAACIGERGVLSHMLGLLAPTVEALPQTLTLDANAVELDKGRAYDVVQFPVIEGVLRFLEAPDCVHQLALQTAKEKDERADLERIQGTKADIDVRRAFWMRRARAKADSDVEALQAQNDAEFKRYVRHIQQFFDFRLQAALIQKQKEEQAAMEEIQLFFAQQEQMLRDKCESCVKASQTLDGPVQEAQSLVAEIFRPDLTMKLALASVLLGTAALDEACRAVIKQDPALYFKAKEWQSDLISDRYHREVLPSMTALQVLQALSLRPPDSYLSKVHLENDMKARRKIAEQEMRAMTNDALIAVTCEPSAWPDLIEAELAVRRQSRGSGALNVQLSVGQPLKLERDNTTVELTQALRYVAVQGVVKVRSGSCGKPYFEVSIDSLDAAVGSTVCIGWDVARRSLHPSPIPGLTAGEELTGESDTWGISLQNDGFIHMQGKTEVVACAFGGHSVVGCGLDLSNHRVTYYIDGKPLPLDVSHGNIKAANIKVRSPYTLVAAATMYGARLDSKCRLTFNFTGPFRHEQLVKAAFWEPLADIAFKQN